MRFGPHGQKDRKFAKSGVESRLALVEVNGVAKSYGGHLGLHDLTFGVDRGQILGLLGPNGAGKTTTLRILTGYLPASRGTVTVDGFSIEDQPFEVRRRIGYVPDNPPLYPEMTVRRYLQFMAELRLVPAKLRKARMDRAMEMLNIKDVSGRLIGHLSRGYRQRVGLAQALLHEPPVLVMDEPTVGLDPRQIADMRELVRRLGKEHAVVLSSHILPEVQAVCGRIIILDKGRAVAEDTPEGLRRAMRGNRTLIVTVRAPADTARAALQRVDHVTAAEPQTGAESGESSFRLTVDAGADVRAEVSAACAQGGLPLLELRSVDVSLEEVFLRLTTEEASAHELVDRRPA
jgi:ABC-2 type transport system ATP-binding protein